MPRSEHGTGHSVPTDSTAMVPTVYVNKNNKGNNKKLGDETGK